MRPTLLPPLLTRLLLACVLLLAQQLSATHFLAHLKAPAGVPSAHASVGHGHAPHPASHGVCEQCLGAASLAAALPPSPALWASADALWAPPAHAPGHAFTPPTRTAFDSRAPPVLS